MRKEDAPPADSSFSWPRVPAACSNVEEGGTVAAPTNSRPEGLRGSNVTDDRDGCFFDDGLPNASVAAGGRPRNLDEEAAPGPSSGGTRMRMGDDAAEGGSAPPALTEADAGDEANPAAVAAAASADAAC